MNIEAFLPYQNQDGSLSCQTVAFTGVTANAALSVKGPMLRIANVGAGNAYVAFSNDPSAAITVAQGFYIPAGAVAIVTRPPLSDRIVAIGSAAGDLNVCGGTGL